MKLIVLCNSAGEISSVASMPDGGPSVSFRGPDSVGRGIVIEAQEITDDMPASEVVARLHEIRDRHRVDIKKNSFVPK